MSMLRTCEPEKLCRPCDRVPPRVDHTIKINEQPAQHGPVDGHAHSLVAASNVQLPYMQLQLTSEELQVLRDLLSRELGNVKEEAYHTDSQEYKRLVKDREASIVSLLAKIQDETART